MSIIANKDTKLIFQGMTGKWGQYYSKRMIDYGTNIVAGVTPGRSGETVHEVPIYDNIREALDHESADASITFTPASTTKNAILESIDAGLKLIICIVEGVPVHDMMIVRRRLRDSDAILIGPNSPGIITPGEFISGFMPANAFKKGNVGIMSRSGTLTYQVAHLLSEAGYGQSTCLGLGGDPIVGLSYIDVLKMFGDDPETDLVVLIGEIGGAKEEEAAAFIQKEYKKPVVAFIAGRSAPEGKTMGHAGAIVSEGKGTYGSKVTAFNDAGVPVAAIITDIPRLVGEKLGK
ncbi:MAG: succinate--CoA ligase subunit alpha [Deltaproteobacteria bacterium]|nr:succinate--CoA ligase subunit alpha [Deltaproteobacteria bacterium]